MRRERFVAAVAAGMGVFIVVFGGSAGAQSGQDIRPTLAPIQATFMPNLMATRYATTLDDPSAGPETPSPDWQWALTPPADDPTCDELEIPVRSPRSSSVIWYHGDENGCKHAGTEHLGRIDVVVKTRGWTCSATIVGTLTREGPEPDLCFRPTPPQPPPPASSSAPSIRDIEKKGWLDASTAATAAGVAFNGLTIGCALVPTPDPVTKGIAVLGLVVTLGYYAYGQYAYNKYKDPPDKNYKQLAKVVVPRLPQVRAGAGIMPAEAAATNALTANLARIAAYDAAFIASFERAQGAYAARDGTWDRRQSRAAASHARAEAKLLDARPALEAALRQAIEKARVPALTMTDAQRAVQHLAKRGLSARFAANAKRLGMGGAPLLAFEKAAAKAKPAAISGPVAAKVGSAAVVNAYRSSAKLLRALAARLAKR